MYCPFTYLVSLVIPLSNLNLTLNPFQLITISIHPPEHKLRRLQTNTTVLQQLKDRREHCIERLLASDIPIEQRISDLELDQPLSQQQLVRIINPHQPLTVGEVLHLVKHDELQEEEDTEDIPESHPVGFEVENKQKEKSSSESSSSATPPPSR